MSICTALSCNLHLVWHLAAHGPAHPHAQERNARSPLSGRGRPPAPKGDSALRSPAAAPKRPSRGRRRGVNVVAACIHSPTPFHIPLSGPFARHSVSQAQAQAPPSMAMDRNPWGIRQANTPCSQFFGVWISTTPIAVKVSTQISLWSRALRFFHPAAQLWLVSAANGPGRLPDSIGGGLVRHVRLREPSELLRYTPAESLKLPLHGTPYPQLSDLLRLALLYSAHSWLNELCGSCMALFAMALAHGH